MLIVPKLIEQVTGIIPYLVLLKQSMSNINLINDLGSRSSPSMMSWIEVAADEEYVLDVQLFKRNLAQNSRDGGKAIAPRFDATQF